VRKKPSGRATSVPVGLAWGAGVEAVLTGAIAMLLAWLVDKEIMPQASIGYGVMVLLTMSAFLGAKTAIWKIKRRRLLISVLTGLLYFGMLMACTALFFGGQYQAVLETMLMIICGSILAAITGYREKRESSRHKIKIPSC